MHKLKVTVREKNKVSLNQLRKKGLIPAVYYYHGEKSIPLSIDRRTLLSALRAHDPNFYLSNGKKAIIKSTDRDYLGNIYHVNFQGVADGETFNKIVPVKLIFDEKSPWVKSGKILRQHFFEVEISTTPENAPEYIHLDLTNTEPDEIVKVENIICEGFNILLPKETPIVSFSYPDKVEVEEKEQVVE